MNSSRMVEEERAKFRRIEQELKDENTRLLKHVAELEAMAEVQHNQYKAELTKLDEEKMRLLHEVDELRTKYDDSHTTVETQRETEKALRKEISRLTFANDELTEKIAYYQRRYKNAISEYEDEIAKKRVSEISAREDLTLRKLSDIEQKLANLHVVLSPTREEIPAAAEEESHGRVDTEKLLEGDSESFENKLENYQKYKGKTDNILRKLTRKILEKEELQNSHVRELFKLDDINLDDKANEYKNLLKAMGALYYANRPTKLVAGLFSYWKAATAEALERKNEAAQAEGESGEQQEQEPSQPPAAEKTEEQPQAEQKQEEDENEPTEEQKQKSEEEASKEHEEAASKPAKPGIEINTELANREGVSSDELINELQINTNKEPSSLEADQGLLRQQKKQREEKSAGEKPSEQPIHIDENYDAKAEGEAEPEEYDQEEFESETPEAKKEGKKVRLEDIDENELQDLVTQLREHLIEELHEEMEKQKEEAEKKAPEIAPEADDSAAPAAGEEELYRKMIGGTTDYFFNMFNKSVQYAKFKRTYHRGF